MPKLNTNQIIEDLEKKRAEILYTLCEDCKFYHHEILVSLVYELRSITSALKSLKDGKLNA